MNARGHAVWTDFGGVLTPPAAADLRAFCDRVGVPSGPLSRAVMRVAVGFGTDDPMEPLDTPLVSEAEWTRRVEHELAAECGRRVSLGDFGSGWFADRPVNRAWLDVLARLRAQGVFVGMVSNMVPTWEPHWRRMVPPDTFDQVVLSHQVGCRKPMRRIFELSAHLAGVPARRCVLIDDMPRNCAGARAAGWHAIEFDDATSAARRLASWLSEEIRPGEPGMTTTKEDRE